jgi:hypothetical protein
LRRFDDMDTTAPDWKPWDCDGDPTDDIEEELYLEAEEVKKKNGGIGRDGFGNAERTTNQ